MEQPLLPRRGTAAELWVARCPQSFFKDSVLFASLQLPPGLEAGAFAARAPTRSRLADPKASHQQPVWFPSGLSSMIFCILRPQVLFPFQLLEDDDADDDDGDAAAITTMHGGRWPQQKPQ